MCWLNTRLERAGEIELAISCSRFEYYRREPRLNGQGNAYAELEMPEVRELADEFQKQHSLHRWSTFNQAYNVYSLCKAVSPTRIISTPQGTRIGRVTRSRY